MSRYDHSQSWQKPEPLPYRGPHYNEPIPRPNGTDLPVTTTPQFTPPTTPAADTSSRALTTDQLVAAAKFGRDHPDPRVRAVIAELLQHADHMDHVIRADADATRLYQARRHVTQLESHAEHLAAMVDGGAVVGSRKRALMHALEWALPVLARVTSEDVGRHTRYI